MANNEIVVGIIEDVAGHDVLPLIDILKDRKNVSEFTIAEELKEEINTIRNKLYRLYDSNLVEFTRRKDKKKGWYIYYWTFVPSRIPFLIKSMKKKRVEKLKEKLLSEQNTNFFLCRNKCLRLTFDKAIDYEFKCPECGELMNQEDNAERIENIIKEIAALEKEVEGLPSFKIESPKIEKKQRISVIQNPMKVKSVKTSKKGKK